MNIEAIFKFAFNLHDDQRLQVPEEEAGQLELAYKLFLWGIKAEDQPIDEHLWTLSRSLPLRLVFAEVLRSVRECQENEQWYEHIFEEGEGINGAISLVTGLRILIATHHTVAPYLLQRNVGAYTDSFLCSSAISRWSSIVDGEYSPPEKAPSSSEHDTRPKMEIDPEVLSREIVLFFMWICSSDAELALKGVVDDIRKNAAFLAAVVFDGYSSPALLADALSLARQSLKLRSSGSVNPTLSCEGKLSREAIALLGLLQRTAAGSLQHFAYFPKLAVHDPLTADGTPLQFQPRVRNDVAFRRAMMKKATTPVLSHPESFFVFPLSSTEAYTPEALSASVRRLLSPLSSVSSPSLASHSTSTPLQKLPRRTLSSLQLMSCSSWPFVEAAVIFSWFCLDRLPSFRTRGIVDAKSGSSTDDDTLKREHSSEGNPEDASPRYYLLHATASSDKEGAREDKISVYLCSVPTGDERGSAASSVSPSGTSQPPPIAFTIWLVVEIGNQKSGTTETARMKLSMKEGEWHSIAVSVLPDKKQSQTVVLAFIDGIRMEQALLFKTVPHGANLPTSINVGEVEEGEYLNGIYEGVAMLIGASHLFKVPLSPLDVLAVHLAGPNTTDVLHGAMSVEERIFSPSLPQTSFSSSLSLSIVADPASSFPHCYAPSVFEASSGACSFVAREGIVSEGKDKIESTLRAAGLEGDSGEHIRTFTKESNRFSRALLVSLFPANSATADDCVFGTDVIDEIIRSAVDESNLLTRAKRAKSGLYRGFWGGRSERSKGRTDGSEQERKSEKGKERRRRESGHESRGDDASVSLAALVFATTYAADPSPGWGRALPKALPSSVLPQGTPLALLRGEAMVVRRSCLASSLLAIGGIDVLFPLISPSVVGHDDRGEKAAKDVLTTITCLLRASPALLSDALALPVSLPNGLGFAPANAGASSSFLPSKFNSTSLSDRFLQSSGPLSEVLEKAAMLDNILYSIETLFPSLALLCSCTRDALSVCPFAEELALVPHSVFEVELRKRYFEAALERRADASALTSAVLNGRAAMRFLSNKAFAGMRGRLSRASSFADSRSRRRSRTSGELKRVQEDLPAGLERERTKRGSVYGGGDTDNLPPSAFFCLHYFAEALSLLDRTPQSGKDGLETGDAGDSLRGQPWRTPAKGSEGLKSTWRMIGKAGESLRGAWRGGTDFLDEPLDWGGGEGPAPFESVREAAIACLSEASLGEGEGEGDSEGDFATKKGGRKQYKCLRLLGALHMLLDLIIDELLLDSAEGVTSWDVSLRSMERVIIRFFNSILASVADVVEELDAATIDSLCKSAIASFKHLECSLEAYLSIAAREKEREADEKDPRAAVVDRALHMQNRLKHRYLLRIYQQTKTRISEDVKASMERLLGPAALNTFEDESVGSIHSTEDDVAIRGRRSNDSGSFVSAVEYLDAAESAGSLAKEAMKAFSHRMFRSQASAKSLDSWTGRGAGWRRHYSRFLGPLRAIFLGIGFGEATGSTRYLFSFATTPFFTLPLSVRLSPVWREVCSLPVEWWQLPLRPQSSGCRGALVRREVASSALVALMAKAKQHVHPQTSVQHEQRNRLRWEGEETAKSEEEAEGENVFSGEGELRSSPQTKVGPTETGESVSNETAIGDEGIYRRPTVSKKVIAAALRRSTVEESGMEEDTLSLPSRYALSEEDETEQDIDEEEEEQASSNSEKASRQEHDKSVAVTAKAETERLSPIPSIPPSPTSSTGPPRSPSRSTSAVLLRVPAERITVAGAVPGVLELKGGEIRFWPDKGALEDKSVSAVWSIFTKRRWSLFQCSRMLIGRRCHLWRAIELHFDNGDGEEGAFRFALLPLQVKKAGYSLAEREGIRYSYLDRSIMESDIFKKVLRRRAQIQLASSPPSGSSGMLPTSASFSLSTVSQLSSTIASYLSGAVSMMGFGGAETEPASGSASFTSSNDSAVTVLDGDDMMKIVAGALLRLPSIRKLPVDMKPTEKEVLLGSHGVKLLMKRMAKITEWWRKRQITNFDYLMHINYLSGRTFQDTSQYPIFPWVLSDYTSETLNLEDERVYRDFAWPIGAQREDVRNDAIEKYAMLSMMKEETIPPRHFGTHYSTPAGVFFFLVRCSPFTELAMELQGGELDVGDRLFSDIAGQVTYRGASTNPNDVRELIPELFCDHRMFHKTNNVFLGRSQTGEEIGDVRLPTWARGSPSLFIHLHRQALESEYVSERLGLWIDLIFGVAQTGKLSEKKVNIYDATCYETMVNLSSPLLSPKDKERLQQQIQEFGQTPVQIFFEQHPVRYRRRDGSPPPLSDLFRDDDESETHLAPLSKVKGKMDEPPGLLVGIKEGNAIIEVKGVSGSVLVHRWEVHQMREDVEERMKSGERLAVGRLKSVHRRHRLVSDGGMQRQESRFRRFFRSFSSAEKDEARPLSAFLPSSGDHPFSLPLFLSRPLSGSKQTSGKGTLVPVAPGRRFALGWLSKKGLPYTPITANERLRWKITRGSLPSLLFSTGFSDGSVRVLTLDASRERYETHEVAVLRPFPGAAVGTSLSYDREGQVLAVSFSEGQLCFFSADVPSEPFVRPLWKTEWRRQSCFSSLTAVDVSKEDDIVVYSSLCGSKLATESLFTCAYLVPERKRLDLTTVGDDGGGIVDEIKIVKGRQKLVVRCLRPSTILVLTFDLEVAQRLTFAEEGDAFSFSLFDSAALGLPHLLVTTSDAENPVIAFEEDKSTGLYRRRKDLLMISDLHGSVVVGQREKDRKSRERFAARLAEGAPKDSQQEREKRLSAETRLVDPLLFGEVIAEKSSDVDRAVMADDSGRVSTIEDLLKNVRMLRKYLADSLGV